MESRIKMSFNPTDAAFEGFRLARRAPFAILAWALAYAVFFLAFFVVAGRSLVTIITMAEQIEQTSQPSMAQLEPLMQAYGVLMIWALPLGLLFGAVLSAAIVRSVLRPEEARFGYMRLGGDELRVLGVSVVVGIIMMLASVIVFGLAGFLGGLAGGLNAPFLWLPAVLLGLAGVGGLIWLAVRLSLAVPITFAERRIAVLDSFRLTKGRFWPLLGMAVIAGVMSLLVAFLGAIVAAPLTMIFGGLERLANQDGGVVAILQAAWPALLVWTIVNAILSAAQAAIVYAPFSVAYRELRQG